MPSSIITPEKTPYVSKQPLSRKYFDRIPLEPPTSEFILAESIADSLMDDEKTVECLFPALVTDCNHDRAFRGSINEEKLRCELYVVCK